MARFQCPRCRALADAAPGSRLRCVQCGYEDTTPGAAGDAPPQAAGPASRHAAGVAQQPVQGRPWRTVSGQGAPAPAATPMVPVTPPGAYGASQASWHTPGGRPPATQGVAIAALLINILLLPGVGSLIGGRTREGIWQLVLWLSPLLLFITLIGILLLPLGIVAAITGWIWAIVTGVQILQESNQAHHPSG